MRLIVILAAGFVLYMFPAVRILVFNLHFALVYAPYDFILYMLHKGWRNLKTGDIVCYCSPFFGGGKTLSGVAYVEHLYEKYNDRIVFDFAVKKYVKQKVDIYSNVAFEHIPFKHLTSLSQLCDVASSSRLYDEKNETLTCSLFLIDEAGSELNSRSFKDNLNPLAMKELVTCRHNHISVILTSQDFSLVDALMRRVTTKVIYAFKTWRICVHKYYDPKQLENAGSYLLISPIRSGGFFVRNKHYSAYDTYAVVDKLNKRFEEGDLLSEEEILSNLSLAPPDPSTVLKPSGRFVRAKRNLNRKTRVK